MHLPALEETTRQLGASFLLSKTIMLSMKLSRHLFVILPLSAAVGLAQTAVSTVVSVGQTPATGVAVTPPRIIANPDPTPVVTAAATQATGETAITLDISHGIRPVPASRVTVPVGEILRITGPDSRGRPYQWLKNGAPLAGATTNPLILPFVTSADAGTYSVFSVDPLAITSPSQSVILGVGPTDRLLNLSTRANIGSGPAQGLIAGFVVGGGVREKKLILRAIGPSLSLFGLSGALQTPVLRIFDSSGRPYQNGYAYPAVIGGPTYESDLAESLARTGAFPYPAGTRDVVVMMPFAPGSYTAQLTSGDGTTGTVLLEIYEVP